MRADADFGTAVTEARHLGLEALKDEAYRRAHAGVSEPVFYQGRQVATIQKYSDTLLMFLIKQGDPSYRDSYHAPEEGPQVSIRDVMAAIRPEPDAGPA